MHLAIRFFIFLSLIFLVNCQSTTGLQSPSSQSQLTLEEFHENWIPYLMSVHEHEPLRFALPDEELFSFCEKHGELCEERTKSKPKPAKITKDRVALFRENLKSMNFRQLSENSVDVSLKIFSKFRDQELLEAAQILLTDSSCQTADVKHALGSVLEDLMPDSQVKERVLGLYLANTLCSPSRTGTLSAYRASMLQLLDHNCKGALPLLEKIMDSQEDHLKPRASYWSWKCQSPGSDSSAQKMALALPYFSYHRILIEEEFEQMPPSDLKPQTPLQLTTEKNKDLNQAARNAEQFLSADQKGKARYILEKVRPDIIFETEPEFQVYWAYLLHQSQAGIRKFQILSNLVNRYPEYRSKIVKSMLFPNWYFEHVEAHAKTLDPWLIQSLIRQESAFDPQAKSRVGATGLMQLMPGTARRIARAPRQKLKDPAHNVQVGIKFLEHLVARYDGQIHLALAAYNAGPGKVDEWVKRYPTNDAQLFVDTIPYRETREYVAFILRNYYWYKSLNIVPVPEPTLTSDYKGRFSEIPIAY